MKDKEKEFKERVECGIAYCEDTPNKQIEEMANDMDYACTQRDLYPSDAKEIAKALYLLNYRKLPEDSVVLSKAEKEKLLKEMYEQGKFDALADLEKDGKVVLSREEYEEYKKVADGKAIMVENITDLNRLVQFPIEYDNKKFEDIADFGNYIQEQSSKETAEKCIKDVREMLRDCDTVYEDDDYHISPDVGYLKKDVDDGLNKIAKQLGVEVK